MVNARYSDTRWPHVALKLRFQNRVRLLIIQDFNNVLEFDEKCHGVDVTPYEVRDFASKCWIYRFMIYWVFLHLDQ